MNSRLTGIGLVARVRSRVQGDNRVNSIPFPKKTVVSSAALQRMDNGSHVYGK